MTHVSFIDHPPLEYMKKCLPLKPYRIIIDMWCSNQYSSNECLYQL